MSQQCVTGFVGDRFANNSGGGEKNNKDIVLDDAMTMLFEGVPIRSTGLVNHWECRLFLRRIGNVAVH